MQWPSGIETSARSSPSLIPLPLMQNSARCNAAARRQMENTHRQPSDPRDHLASAPAEMHPDRGKNARRDVLPIEKERSSTQQANRIHRLCTVLLKCVRECRQADRDAELRLPRHANRADEPNQRCWAGARREHQSSSSCSRVSAAGFMLSKYHAHESVSAVVS